MPGQINRSFIRLAAGAAIVTFLMIVIGAITRVTESGMGCGPYWPSCNGRIVPEFQTIEEVIEMGHRLFALLVGAFGLGVIVQAWREYRQEPRLFYPAVLGAMLFFAQSLVGALTVAVYNKWESVMLHLGTAMIMLATYTVLWVNARRLNSPQSATGQEERKVILPPAEVYIAAALSFLVAMIGAVVAGTDATKACVGWPLCGGEVWPAQQGPLQILNMLHRIAAGALGLMLIVMLFQARGGVDRLVRNALWAALALYVLQSLIGASVVLIDNRDWLTLTRALHVTFAAATWAVMIMAGASAWLQLSPVKRAQATPEQAAPASSATISN